MTHDDITHTRHHEPSRTDDKRPTETGSGAPDTDHLQRRQDRNSDKTEEAQAHPTPREKPDPTNP